VPFSGWRGTLAAGPDFRYPPRATHLPSLPPARQPNGDAKSISVSPHLGVPSAGGRVYNDAMIAALYVEKGGCYAGLPNIDLWCEARDARLYAGPHPVVAHPPCSRWCRLAGLVEARWGHKRGEDGGCFHSALESVRKWGGVLEHPAYTDAFAAFGVPSPETGLPGWQRTLDGGWITYVEQHAYGHPAKKATWLYAFGLDDPPPLRWTFVRDNESTALVSWCGNHVKSGETRPRVGKKVASATPIAFRDVLLDIARRCR